MNGRLVLLLIFVAVCVAGGLLALLKDKLNAMEPVIEIEAEVLSKRAVAQSHRGAYGSTNGHYYIVTFRTENGEVVELRTPEGSGIYEENSEGILIYQADKCEKFTPYGGNDA